MWSCASGFVANVYLACSLLGVVRQAAADLLDTAAYSDRSAHRRINRDSFIYAPDYSHLPVPESAVAAADVLPTRGGLRFVALCVVLCVALGCNWL